MEVDFILILLPAMGKKAQIKSGYPVPLTPKAGLSWGKASGGMGLSPGVSKWKCTGGLQGG